VIYFPAILLALTIGTTSKVSAATVRLEQLGSSGVVCDSNHFQTFMKRLDFESRFFWNVGPGDPRIAYPRGVSKMTRAEAAAYIEKLSEPLTQLEEALNKKFFELDVVNSEIATRGWTVKSFEIRQLTEEIRDLNASLTGFLGYFRRKFTNSKQHLEELRKQLERAEMELEDVVDLEDRPSQIQTEISRFQNEIRQTSQTIGKMQAVLGFDLLLEKISLAAPNTSVSLRKYIDAGIITNSEAAAGLAHENLAILRHVQAFYETGPAQNPTTNFGTIELTVKRADGSELFSGKLLVDTAKKQNVIIRGKGDRQELAHLLQKYHIQTISNEFGDVSVKQEQNGWIDFFRKVLRNGGDIKLRSMSSGP